MQIEFYRNNDISFSHFSLSLDGEAVAAAAAAFNAAPPSILLFLAYLSMYVFYMLYFLLQYYILFVKQQIKSWQL